MSDANYDEYRRSRMSNDERQGIMTLDMLSRSFSEAAIKLAGRLKNYRYLKRDLGAINGALVRIRKAALDGVCRDVAYFARQEGLEAHAKSVLIRCEGDEPL